MVVSNPSDELKKLMIFIIMLATLATIVMLVWHYGVEGPGQQVLPRTPERTLNATLEWYGNNRQQLDTMIAEYGSASADYNPAQKPVATFDWDNTVIKNDIGAATLYWMIQHEKVQQPPGADWHVIPYLTDEAVETMSSVCGAVTPPGSPLPTATNHACANELVSLNDNKTLTNGQAAFTGYNYRTYDPGCAMQSYILAGYTPDEVRAIAGQVIEANLGASIGSTQRVGDMEEEGYIRIYPQILDLIGTLHANGFDVWIVSASPQYIVESFAARVGIPADHVIGVRSMLDERGRLTYNLEGCGPVSDKENSLFTYITGKRCWINKVIYNDTSANAINIRTSGDRPVFAAGDSNTDVAFMQDATALRLVINRNSPELMCNAYASKNTDWLINPMFIAPKPLRNEPYNCSMTACRNERGDQVPCRNAAGKIIPDQNDTVYGTR